MIHSTNKPWSIGDFGSHGCIRMYPEDAEVIFNKINIDDSVRIIDEPIKFGFINEDLYIEVACLNRSILEPYILDNITAEQNLDNIKHIIINKYSKYEIDEAILHKALTEQNSIPIKITR